MFTMKRASASLRKDLPVRVSAPLLRSKKATGLTPRRCSSAETTDEGLLALRCAESEEWLATSRVICSESTSRFW